MEELDQQILDIIQTDFPLESRPYLALAQRLQVSEQEVFERVCKLREDGVIRQLSANFWAGKLGYVSTLCGAKVPPDKLESFVEMVNSCASVTHNYLRDHPYNVWFTLICASKAQAEEILADFTRLSGVKILNLPATKIFKINVNFKMQQDT
ncbi:MAG: AsnC family transcriptional regulator [Desulfovibrionaceae bacterium]|nr:AsnC family transcriptional regulator [Desulfovibrionaceae bacterium]